MPTLVLSPRHTPDGQHMAYAARTAGWDVVRAHGYYAKGVDDPVVYGEIVFCDIMAEQLGVKILEPSNDWLARLPEQYLLRKVRASIVGKLDEVTEVKFIKPANDKAFKARTQRGAEVICGDPNTPVLISDVVKFTTEVRCHVLDRKIITATIYAHDVTDRKCGDVTLMGVRQWLGYLLDDDRVELPSAIVIDVGFIRGTGWAVIEANPVSASGIYAEGALTEDDLVSLLPVLQRAGSTKVQPFDEKWVRDGNS